MPQIRQAILPIRYGTLGAVSHVGNAEFVWSMMCGSFRRAHSVIVAVLAQSVLAKPYKFLGASPALNYCYSLCYRNIGNIFHKCLHTDHSSTHSSKANHCRLQLQLVSRLCDRKNDRKPLHVEAVVYLQDGRPCVPYEMKSEIP